MRIKELLKLNGSRGARHGELPLLNKEICRDEDHMYTICDWAPAWLEASNLRKQKVAHSIQYEVH